MRGLSRCAIVHTLQAQRFGGNSNILPTTPRFSVALPIDIMSPAEADVH